MRSKVKTQDEKGENPSRGEKIKEIVLLLLLNVILPSVDVYSDIGLILKFYVKGSRSDSFCDAEYGWWQLEERLDCYDNHPASSVTYTLHPNWGTMMLLPFLLNYLICWYVWATTDKRKTVTWVAALLSFHPQYVACKITEMEKRKKIARTQIWAKEIAQKSRNLRQSTIRAKTA